MAKLKATETFFFYCSTRCPSKTNNPPNSCLHVCALAGQWDPPNRIWILCGRCLHLLSQSNPRPVEYTYTGRWLLSPVGHSGHVRSTVLVIYDHSSRHRSTWPLLTCGWEEMHHKGSNLPPGGISESLPETSTSLLEQNTRKKLQCPQVCINTWGTVEGPRQANHETYNPNNRNSTSNHPP